MPRLSTTLIDVKASLWFAPVTLALAAIVVARSLVAVDARVDQRLDAALPWLGGGEPGVATNVLTVIAGSMITVATLVFTLTLVALTLASTQFSPRILRMFMRDRITQTVLGFFVSVFVYCLVVLRTIRTDAGGLFVPSLAVTVGAALGLAAMGVLVYFMHHIANSINASNIIATIAAETLEVIDEIYPQGTTAADPASVEAELASAEWRTIAAAQTGYIRSIDFEGLADAASECGATIRLHRRVGEFVVQGVSLASVSGDSVTLARAIEDCCDVDPQRTMEQDIAFGIRQLVDIALKALSSAVNDTTTALTCVDHLSAVGARLATRSVGPIVRRDGGRIRLYVPAQSLEDFLDLAFNQIRQNAGGNVAVMIRLLGAVETVALAGGTSTPEGAEILASQVRNVADLAERTVEPAEDRDAVARRARALEARLATLH
jgi:uncharacterized membrane protein